MLYEKQYYIASLHVYFAANDLLSLEIKMRKGFPSSLIVPDSVYSPTSFKEETINPWVNSWHERGKLTRVFNIY